MVYLFVNHIKQLVVNASSQALKVGEDVKNLIISETISSSACICICIYDFWEWVSTFCSSRIPICIWVWVFSLQNTYSYTFSLLYLYLLGMHILLETRDMHMQIPAGKVCFRYGYLHILLEIVLLVCMYKRSVYSGLASVRQHT